MTKGWTKAVSQFIKNRKSEHGTSQSRSVNQSPIEKNPHCYSDRLKVFVGTWNMYGRLLPIDLSTFLTENNPNHENMHHHRQSNGLDGTATHPYHLLVIGTQECERDISESLFYPSKEVWEKRLSDYLGLHYKLVQTETLAALHVAVFVWLPVKHLVKDVQHESIKTGWANMVGNKGAVAISILFGSRSLLFINCHLTAHQTKLAERNANVERILTELDMPNFKTKKNKKKSYPSVIDQFDHVFLFGDTNYRINAERSFVFEAIKQGDYNMLLQYDQLSAERITEGSPLAFFQEHPIQFPPTYKLDTIITRKLTTHTNSEDSDSSLIPVCDQNNNNNNTTMISLSTTSTTSLPTTPKLTTKQSVKTSLSNTKARSVKSIKRRLSTKKKQQQQQTEPMYQMDDTAEILSEPELNHHHALCDSNKIPLFDSDVILCYDSSEKQRVPSWTDRILWCDRAASHHIAPPLPATSSSKKKKRRPFKSQKASLSIFPFNRNNRHCMRDTVCYSYDAVLHESLFGVSDHMPVIGVFGIYFDEWSNPPINQKIIKLNKTATIQSNHTRQSNKRSTKRKFIWWQRMFG